MIYSSENLHLLVNLAPWPVLLVNTQRKIVCANAALEALFEYGPGELNGQPLNLLIPPGIKSGHEVLAARYLESPNDKNMGIGRDLQGYTKSGALIPVEVGLHVAHMDGEAHALTNVIDISARLNDRRTTAFALNATASAMLLVNEDEQIVMANDLTYHLFGYEHGGLLGRNVSEIIRPDAGVAPIVEAQSTGSADEPDADRSSTFAAIGQANSGEPLPLQVNRVRITNHSAALSLYTVIDLSERQRVELEIAEKNRMLRRKNQELMSFAYSASHELKAPLNTITGLLDCMQEDLRDGDTEALLENIHRAHQMTAQLVDVVENTLALARSDSMTEARSNVQLRALIQVLFETHNAMMLEKGVMTFNEVPSTFAMVTQPTRIRLVLDNLIDNAIKYSDQNKRHRYVRVSAEEHNGMVDIEVADNGIGIPHGRLDQAMAMFQRLDNHGEPAAASACRWLSAVCRSWAAI